VQSLVGSGSDLSAVKGSLCAGGGAIHGQTHRPGLTSPISYAPSFALVTARRHVPLPILLSAAVIAAAFLIPMTSWLAAISRPGVSRSSRRPHPTTDRPSAVGPHSDCEHRRRFLRTVRRRGGMPAPNSGATWKKRPTHLESVDQRSGVGGMTGPGPGPGVGGSGPGSGVGAGGTGWSGAGPGGIGSGGPGCGFGSGDGGRGSSGGNGGNGGSGVVDMPDNFPLWEWANAACPSVQPG
jgi:hypothetical protein